MQRATSDAAKHFSDTGGKAGQRVAQCAALGGAVQAQLELQLGVRLESDIRHQGANAVRNQGEDTEEEVSQTNGRSESGQCARDAEVVSL
jgi:hypothetical protein